MKRAIIAINLNKICMQMWTAEFCRADTDEDGKTNGEELGDPNCQWIEGGTPARTTDITHPGIYIRSQRRLTKHSPRVQHSGLYAFKGVKLVSAK